MKRRGLTMIETLVSLCLFLLVVILVFNLYPGSLLGLRRSEQRTEANRLAQDVLEQARALPFDEIAPRSYAVDGYTYRLDVEPAESGELKRLKVRVEWEDRSVSHELWVARVR